MKYWLVKTEPTSYSIEDLARDKVTCWDGVRNYQARNFLREMSRGDHVLFYHSSAEPTGVAGLAKVVKEAYPELAQFDKRSKYFDSDSPQDNPRWFSPDLRFVERFAAVIALGQLRKAPKLKDMELLRRGSRLSVQPVTKQQYETVLALAGKASK